MSADARWRGTVGHWATRRSLLLTLWCERLGEHLQSLLLLIHKHEVGKI
jgi:hypothetical protein